MASRYQIQMDFNQASRKANEVENIANSLKRLSGTELQNMLDGLANDWKGENAKLYLCKGFILKANMERTADSLRETASAIRTIARNIYNAEMEALRIIEEREAARRAEEAASEGNFSSGGGSGGGGGGGSW